jgi:hypothetical protein
VSKFKARALVINVVGNDFDESRIEYASAPGFWYYAPGTDGELHLQLVEYHPGAVNNLLRRSALVRYVALNLGTLGMFNELVDLFQRHDDGNSGRQSPSRPQDNSNKGSQYAGFTLADPFPPRVAASKAAVDAFLRDLSQIGLSAQCVAFTVDGSRYPDRVKHDAGTFFDIMRRYFIERASARGYEAIDLDPRFLARYQETAERFDFPNDGHWNENGHRVVADALRSSMLLNSSCDLRRPLD